MSNKTLYLLLAFAVFSCGRNEGELFLNPSPKKTGITFTNTVTETDDLNILDYLYFYNGGGVAVGDINNDGLPDIFFSGNQVPNKMYLNKGNLVFEDISEKAGIEGNSSWKTGAVMGDVNGDGFLDIYVCAVVGINGFNGYNELYINNGDNTFTESAAQYGLDFDNYSSNAAFLDFDLDGDLDMYLLNHAVHTPESFGKADLRLKRTYETGDKLLRNDGGRFTDVSEQAGIFGGVNGYGLGIAIADFNLDGWPDIYVGNDFHEDDYYYLNNGDGTFTESLKNYFGHTSRFSMGNDVADINQDGLPDIISLDMLPEDEAALKSSEGDDNPQILKLRTQQYGYHYQYTRNMLHINRGNAFEETALLSGIAATDWSWSALFEDFDSDGQQDLFISNGIPKRPNDLDYIKFISSEQIRRKIDNTKLVDREALNRMPAGKTHNYIFKGLGDLRFQDQSGKWTVKDTLVTGATALADLDNDGDLDLVTNNLNAPAQLYINKTNTKANYLNLHFEYLKPNTFGIGTKAIAYVNGNKLYKELYTVRGFQASSQPMLHFGLGKTETIDSLLVIWPDKTSETLKNVKANQKLLLTPSPNRKPFKYARLKPDLKPIFKQDTSNFGLNFTHIEDNYIDFNRQKLIPFQISDRGPATAVGDLNGDGKDDVFFGGSKYTKAQVFMQQDSAFVLNELAAVANDSICEDVYALIFDVNNDSKNDLLVGSGGGDFFGKMQPLLNRLYLQQNAGFTKQTLAELYANTSVVKPFDVDGDGDQDLFCGSQAYTGDYGKTPPSYVLVNNQGTFNLIENEALANAGMVTDAVWSDFDGDSQKDLIVVGEWMHPKFFKNNKGKLTETNLGTENLKGLWQAIIPFDIDGDGDEDYLLGNWGLNSKFTASEKLPMKMYYADFDANGTTETIVATAKNGKYYPLAGLDELAEQMPTLMRKKFNSYNSFAGKTVEEVFDEALLKKSTLLEVNTLASGWLKNEKGKFNFVPFSTELQLAPITSFVVFDFDSDSKKEVLAAGNYFGVKPFHARFDSFSGAIIKNENTVIPGREMGLNFYQKPITGLNIIHIKNKPYLLVTINNRQSELYEF